MSIDRDFRTTKSEMRALSSLSSEALSQFAKLFQNEVDLAKAELGEKAQKVGVAVGFIGAGAVLVIPGLVMALFTMSAVLIAAGWSQALSYLLSAILAFAVAGILFAIGISRLNVRNLIPQVTMKQLEKDKNTLKEVAR